jgi:hypothetical protein
MEASATSKDRGIDRRVMLMTLARDSEALGKMSVDSPDAFGKCAKPWAGSRSMLRDYWRQPKPPVSACTLQTVARTRRATQVPLKARASSATPTKPTPLLPPLPGVRFNRQRTSTMSITSTPDERRSDVINHLRWEARAVVGLLSAVHLLPEPDKQATLESCSRLMNKMASDLDALVRGTA